MTDTEHPSHGDFGLISVSAEPVGKLIRAGEAVLAYVEHDSKGYGDYEHAFIAVSGPDSAGLVRVVQAMPGGADYGLYRTSEVTWSSWPLTIQQRNRIVGMANSLVAQPVPYSFLDYLAISAHALHLPIPGLRRYVAATGHMICSQLVDTCYSFGGVHLFRDGRWPGYVTPSELAEVLHP